MSDPLAILLGVAAIAGCIVAFQSQSSQPPQVIYVQMAEPEPRGTGCLAWIAIGILLAVVVSVLNGA